MQEGQHIRDDWGREGTVTDSGYSWHDVQWDDGEKEDSVAGWKLREVE